MVEWVQQTDGIWQYIVLFLISILPFLDVFYIIPVGIVLDMSPAAVGIIAFLGNFIMVLVFAMFFGQISNWRNKRREKKGKLKPSKNETRARHIWEKYGLPVFALLSPALLGTDIAALTALLLGSSKVNVITWMGISLVIWSILMTVGSVYGLQYINWL
ncbi:putative membrane protein [Paenibacillus endophyticus]|uniref:Putative membrane protein n=1 Tax=Paenibacillus endophyticus TaxID=1294268 RepID=A0A7W5CCK4_9BACL|nr:small multi-drug export protein [Paenibacillus endophyticus]MBB3155236.1 putative membrane protein [Paenibacillus endophyticus]